MYKYEVSRQGHILKDGHTMFTTDVVVDLNRKSFLEAKVARLEAALDDCISGQCPPNHACPDSGSCDGCRQAYKDEAINGKG